MPVRVKCGKCGGDHWYDGFTYEGYNTFDGETFYCEECWDGDGRECEA